MKVFPSLATRPFILSGESYAGRYIVRDPHVNLHPADLSSHQPYIVRMLFSIANPPVKLSKMVVGDPAFGSVPEFKVLPTVSHVSLSVRTYADWS